MALRQVCNPFNALARNQKAFKVQKRAYTVKPTVSKITLDASRPIGNVSLMFTKQGQALLDIQREISASVFLAENTSIHSTLKNGGLNGILALEIAQQIVASPTLLAQFKKDNQISKEATVGAVNWLYDLRSATEAASVAAKPETAARLSKVVTFQNIVPLKNNLGLNLKLEQEATVGDWWVAYTAASQLIANKTVFGAITGASLSPKQEETLAKAGASRARRALEDASYQHIQNGTDNELSTAITFLNGNAFKSREKTSSVVGTANSLINEASAIPANQYTISEIVTLLARARNELRSAAEGLKAAVDRLQAQAENNAIEEAWQTLRSGSKADIQKAIATIEQNAAQAEPQVADWDILLVQHLPQEAAALSASLEKLQSAVEKLPQSLYDEELTRRIEGHAAEPGYDSPSVLL